MVMQYDPGAPPFWEARRGGGPATSMFATRKRAQELADKRDAKTRADVLERADRLSPSEEMERRELRVQMGTIGPQKAPPTPPPAVAFGGEHWPVIRDPDGGPDIAEDGNGNRWIQPSPTFG